MRAWLSSVNNALPAPSITSLKSTSGVAGTSVTIAGTNFGGTQGTSTVTFSGTVATPTSWSATRHRGSCSERRDDRQRCVTVGSVASNGVGFTVIVPPPSITSLNPTSGVLGTSVTITGANFAASKAQAQ